MTDDAMEEIKQLFFEESGEGLDVMESMLLELNPGAADEDSINTIFRAAHSIKGGSATFGFMQIAELTHGLETLLDEMRSGVRQVTAEAVDVLLKSVDCLREMFDLAKQGLDQPATDMAEVNATIHKMLAGTAESDEAEQASTAFANDEQALSEDAVDTVQEYQIHFKPFEHFFELGNKPELIIRELRNMGELELKTNLDAVPDFEDLVPASCYISFTMTLKGVVSEADINAVFDWVDDVCEYKIERQGAEIQDEVSSESGLSLVESVSTENIIPEAVAQETKAVPKKAAPAKAQGSIRVGIDKIDTLLNLVGELVITQSILKKVGGEISDGLNEDLQNGLTQLESNARELQEVAMKMRMLPVNNVFSRFPRVVHDLSKQLGKKVELTITGEQTELDKTVLEKVGDPLTHLVRNALDHGIESPDKRLESGKNEVGNMTLSAAHEAGNIVISITDDGAGINPEKILNKAREKGIVKEGDTLSPDDINQLIFHAGFSTAEVVSDVSGRGVGMDVVKRNIQDLGGRVEVQSEFGKGSTFKIHLPLTMAILDGQLIRVHDEIFIVPLLNIIESVVIREDKINALSRDAAMYQLRDKNIPMVPVDRVLNVPKATHRNNVEKVDNKILVIVDLGDETAGLIVDELLDQQQVVIKSLETNYKQIAGLSGATILGDGTVALIIDLAGLVKNCFRNLVKLVAA